MKFRIFVMVFIIFIMTFSFAYAEKSNLMEGRIPVETYNIVESSTSNKNHLTDNQENTFVQINPNGYLVYDLGVDCDIDSFRFSGYSQSTSYPYLQFDFYDASDRVISSYQGYFIDEYHIGLEDVRKVRITNKYYYKIFAKELYLYGQQKNVSLDISADNHQIHANDTFDVFVDINDAKDIYAEDFTVTYDGNYVEFIECDVVDAYNTDIYYKEIRTGGAIQTESAIQTRTGSAIRTEGAIRLIVSGNHHPYAINGQKQLIKFEFKTKNLYGATRIDLSSGLLADGEGNEIIPTLNGMTFTILSIPGDVNQDGKVSLADLALTNKFLGTPPSAWGEYYPDSNHDGVVNKLDLIYVTQILSMQ